MQKISFLLLKMLHSYSFSYGLQTSLSLFGLTSVYSKHLSSMKQKSFWKRKQWMFRIKERGLIFTTEKLIVTKLEMIFCKCFNGDLIQL